MSKNKHKNVRICENYAKPCAFANKCESCKDSAKKKRFINGKEVLQIVGCKKGFDMARLPEEKSKCFHCKSEGTGKCKGD